MPKPDAKTFLSDPAHQGDREILEAVIESVLTKKADEARKKKEEEEKNNPPSIWDSLFGGR